MSSMTRPINPYLRSLRPQVQTVPETAQMGPQSQRRLTLQQQTNQLAQNSKKRKKGEQLTLNRDVAFDPYKDCVRCIAKLNGKDSHKGHDKCCWNNKCTKGVVSQTTLASEAESKRLACLFSTPLTAEERGSWRHSTKEAREIFFQRRPTPQSKEKQAPMTTTPSPLPLTPETARPYRVPNEGMKRYNEMSADCSDAKI